MEEKSINNFKNDFFREKWLLSKLPVFQAVNTWCPIFRTLTDVQYDYAMHSGTMQNAMQKIFLRFHHIPSEDLAKMVLANKKKSGLLHFEKLEKMAQEIAEELLMDLMKFTMGG